MSSPQSEASLADASGILLRSAAPRDAEAIARVRIDGWRTAYRGLVPAAYLDGMQVDANTALWDRILSAGPNSASVFVAVRGDEVVGFAAGNKLGEPRYGLDAELTAVYLRREFQRVGIGRRLIAAVVDAQRAYGATGMIVWLLAANKPARAFYEALGAAFLVEQAFQWDGMDLLEVGYGWRDLDQLAAACRAGQMLTQAESPKQDRRAGS
jgi:GNAT superfamily N-acetyltransferase